MSGLYDTEAEASVHAEAIRSLAAETRLPADFVRTVYERELARLKPDVRIKDLLVLFTMRKAREALRTPPLLR